VETPATGRIRAGAPTGPALSSDARFELAERLHERGDYERARHELRAIVRAPQRRADRVRAWNRIADSRVREGDPRQAAEALRRAFQAGPSTAAGLTALVDRARLLRNEIRDPGAARNAYARYLQSAPGGPFAAEARRALCQLGEEWYCE